MKLAFESGASGTPPTPPSSPSVGYPQDGVLGVNPPTVPGAYAFYQLFAELLTVITAAGLTPNLASVTQLKAALELLYAPYGTSAGASTKAWANFDGTASSPVVAAGANVASITKVSTGVYTLTFTTAMANTHYAVSGSISCDQSQNCVITVLAATAGAAATLKTTAAVTVCIAISGGGFFDSVETSVVINSL